MPPKNFKCVIEEDENGLTKRRWVKTDELTNDDLQVGLQSQLGHIFLSLKLPS